MQRRIVLVLGKPPKPGTVVFEVIALLEAQDVVCEVLLPHDGVVDPQATSGADLVVHRGLSAQDAHLLAAIAATGVPLCNPWTGTDRTGDRAEVHRAIADSPVPAPGGVVRHTWSEVLAEEAIRPVVVKAVEGGGRGRGVLAGPLPAEAPMDGPYLVEDLVEHDGVDRKLYVVGDWVRGLLKPSTLLHEHTTEGTPFEVDQALADLGRSTAASLDLHLAGVDVVLGPRGPVVVDVNVFPGYRGVEGAAQAVAEHLLEPHPLGAGPGGDRRGG